MLHDLDPLDSQSKIVDVDGSFGRALPPADEAGPDPASGAGLLVDALEAGTRIIVGTKHSCYRFVVVDGSQRRATVTGGKMFPETTEVRIEGASAGDHVIKAGWLAVGLRAELSIGLKRITTSSVQSLAIEKASPVS
jgi:hypothetical protein